MGNSKKEILKEMELEGNLIKNDFSNLSKGLTINSILKYFTIDEIIERLAEGVVTHDEFIKNFIEKGGDNDSLAIKFVEEIGYPVKNSSGYVTSGDIQRLEFLLEIVCAGTTEIDMAKFKECIENLDVDSRDFFYEKLNDAGVSY